MYKVVKIAGYKGKRLTDESVNSYPTRLLSIWEKAGIIKKLAKEPIKKDEPRRKNSKNSKK